MSAGMQSTCLPSPVLIPDSGFLKMESLRSSGMAQILGFLDCTEVPSFSFSWASMTLSGYLMSESVN